MTKAEFLDLLASDQRIGNKKEAGAAVDAVLDAITDVLKDGGDVNFTGFGKFAVAERGPRQGVNPRTGERIFIPGGKVPRFSAGSGLKKKVKGGSSRQFGRSLRRPPRGSRRRAPQPGLPRTRSRAGLARWSRARRGGGAGGADGASPAVLAASAVTTRCLELIAEAGPACVAVKPQLACFERLGAPGRDALGYACEAAREAGLLVVADGKRGDVPTSAEAYAQSLIGETETPWGAVAGLGADAITANPLLGGDAVEPLVAAAEGAGAGVFCLVRTSNPGAADFQDLDAGGRPLHEHMAEFVAARSGRLAGESGLSGMGAVVGATEPDHLGRMRELMPDAVFLIPGVGAQGGRPEDLGPALSPGRPASILVAAARSIAGAPDPAAAAEELRAALWDGLG